MNDHRALGGGPMIDAGFPAMTIALPRRLDRLAGNLVVEVLLRLTAPERQSSSSSTLGSYS